MAAGCSRNCPYKLIAFDKHFKRPSKGILGVPIIEILSSLPSGGPHPTREPSLGHHCQRGHQNVRNWSLTGSECAHGNGSYAEFIRLICQPRQTLLADENDELTEMQRFGSECGNRVQRRPS